MSAAPLRVGKWRVARTHEEQPCEQFVVCRTVFDGPSSSFVETYQYADTHAEAEQLAREANASGAIGQVSS